MKLLSFFISFVMATMPLSAMAQQGYADSWQLNLMEAASPLKSEIRDFHDLLLIIITGIVIIVTILLAFAVVKFRRRKHVEPATFAHNTLIEVIWTIVPVIILIVIAIPSFKLLYFEDRVPEPELTVKTTGYQWYWGYEYMDYDGLEFLSYPIPDEEIDESIGQRRLLSTDNPVVLPVDTHIQVLVTAGDVLHAFALPSAGIKRDAIPGRLNETFLYFDKVGTYFGQCSEICGTGHAYMPIEIKVVDRPEFDAWVAEQGGTLNAPVDTAENMLENPKVSVENLPNEDGAVEEPLDGVDNDGSIDDVKNDELEI
jgi:cytochrome c oxidase subunit 2